MFAGMNMFWPVKAEEEKSQKHIYAQEYNSINIIIILEGNYKIKDNK